MRGREGEGERERERGRGREREGERERTRGQGSEAKIFKGIKRKKIKREKRGANGFQLLPSSSAASSSSSSPPAARTLHIGKKQFEPITQIHHAGVRGTMQLEAVGNHLHRPAHEFGILAGFEAQVKVTGVFGVDAEHVDGTFGVGFGVGRQPAF